MNSRVLVVEDSPFSREMLCDWLELQGLEVRSASSLSEAMAAIEKYQPEAVLLDVQLGADDGLSLAGWMRQHEEWRHVPVIAVTAHAMVADQERILHSGCNSCLSKPIDFDLLREQLNKWLMVGAVMKQAHPNGGAERRLLHDPISGGSDAQQNSGRGR